MTGNLLLLNRYFSAPHGRPHDFWQPVLGMWIEFRRKLMRRPAPSGLLGKPDDVIGRNTLTNPLRDRPGRAQLAHPSDVGLPAQEIDCCFHDFNHANDSATESGQKQVQSVAVTPEAVPFTLAPLMVEKVRAAKKTTEKPADAEEPRYPGFGRVVTELMRAIPLTDEEVAREIGAQSRQTVAFYRGGWRMPRKNKMKRLADLLGVSVSDLYAADDPDAVQRILGAGELELSPEESRLISDYRKLTPTGRKIIRARVAQLLEQFGKKGPDNPYGRGTQ